MGINGAFNDEMPEEIPEEITFEQLMTPPTAEEVRESFISLVDRLLKYCWVDECSGDWLCRKCSFPVKIDWFEKEINCPCDNCEGE